MEGHCEYGNEPPADVEEISFEELLRRHEAQEHYPGQVPATWKIFPRPGWISTREAPACTNLRLRTLAKSA